MGWHWCMYHCMQLLHLVCSASVIPEWVYKATAGPYHPTAIAGTTYMHLMSSATDVQQVHE